MPSSPRRPRPRFRTAVLASLSALGVAAAVAVPAPAHARAAAFEQRVLFRADRDPGYACFRIPALVRTTDGTLLAFAEGRVRDCGDAADIDIVLKRSTDGGRTWGPLRVVTEGGGDTHGNPAPVVDRATGRVLLVETHNTGRADDAGCAIPCDRVPHLQYSDDDGLTWSEPRDLSTGIRPDDWNSWYATGPVHGVQLTTGAHAGRLVLGVNAETWAGGRVTANHAALVVSDDGGAHWRVGATDTWPVAGDGTFRQKPSEVTLAELGDGSLLVGGREQDGADLGHRAQTVSRDGGDSFAAPFEAVPDLYTPQVQGALLRLGDRVLLSAPADPDRRRTMVIRSSWDGGSTWDSVDRATVVTRDWSGYSDLAALDAASAGLLYEAGTADARDEIRFARFGEGRLRDRRGADPATPDRAPGAAAAAVLGGAGRTADGAVGGALVLDGADDGVRLPYRRELPLGDGDFTASLWFRYTATSGEQPLLWMGGIGTRQPQVWLRAEPARDRVTGLMTARDGTAAPRSAYARIAGARNDGRWHRLVLRRGGGRLTLFLDGERAGTADVPGSVSRFSAFGVHVGARMDGRAHFTGAVDDVRVWRRALTDDEVTGGEAAAGDVVLWLPLDRVDAGG
ncbi:exo-alpha-sialidase [Streptomyces griseoviridis]|uniref:exo-alpha-sialidase n=1 Tax=Streptomyces griseoviridis TaxID=45398 RepID=A0A918LFX2_STRGD|nr:exo-alpha-sialidase [Streptomyces niveoruber]GGS41402.1 neuramidase [Streptomyces niveoruber]